MLFLDSLIFLTPDQRAQLRMQELDTPEAFEHITVARLEEDPFYFSAGRAGKVLAAASAARSTARPPAPAMTVQLADPPNLWTRIDRALAEAHSDPSKLAELLDLGVDKVVVGADDRVDVAATKAMRAHTVAAPVGPTWQGKRVASTRDLFTPPVWCSPRTGRPLQDGKDEILGTPWAQLQLEGLRLAAFGYREEFFVGLSDDVVFTRIQTDADGIRQRLADRMKAMRVSPERMDAVVVYSARASSEATRPIDRAAQPPSTHTSLAGRLHSLLLGLFEHDELRRFVRYLPGGEGVLASAAGGSYSTFAFSVVELWQRRGLVNADLKRRLIAERPRRVDDIESVFEAAGI